MAITIYGWKNQTVAVARNLTVLIASTLSDAVYKAAGKVFAYFEPPFPTLSEERLKERSALFKNTSLFSRDMDLSTRKKVAIRALKELRKRGILLTESEFRAQTAPAWYANCFHQYVCKTRAIDRVFGREVIAQAARDLKLSDIIKVPRKYAIIKPQAPWVSGKSILLQSAEDDLINPNLTIHYKDYLKSDDIMIFAERINPIKHSITRKEMEAILAVIQKTGFSDCLGDNIMVGENQRGERGIYFIDTERASFHGHTQHLERLVHLMNAEDSEWFEEQISRLNDLRDKMPHKQTSEPEADQEPFTVPIAEILSSY